MPQQQADKLLRRVAQPLGRHYNGQGRENSWRVSARAVFLTGLRVAMRRLVRESTYLPLSDDGFSAEFEERWNEHVDFGRAWRGGRSQSEKTEWRVRLAAKKKGSASDLVSKDPTSLGASAPKSGQKRKREPTAPRQEVLANTGRFRGTLAAQLLGV